jgi:hypothetical protein
MNKYGFDFDKNCRLKLHTHEWHGADWFQRDLFSVAASPIPNGGNMRFQTAIFITQPYSFILARFDTREATFDSWKLKLRDDPKTAPRHLVFIAQ